MLRKVALGISYFIAILYVALIALPAYYCWRHGCRGPGEGDAFMPAFMLAPLGSIVTAISLYNSVQNIRKRGPWSWAFWPLAIVFVIVLLGTIAFIATLIYQLSSHR